MQEVYGEWLPQSQNTANLCFSSVVVPSQMDSSIEPQARTCVVVSSEKESSSSLGIVTNVGPTEGIDLNKTPAQKPKRKKHRPKVIKEGQPVKTPKSTTRQPPKEKGEQPSGKRKYVRRKGLNTPASQPPQEGADSHSGTEPKPVRRCLNFNEEGPQENTHLGSRAQATEVSTVTRDSQLSIATGQRNAQVQVACHLGASTSSIYSSTDLMANAQLLQADSMPKGVMFDLNSSINQMPSDRTNFMDNHGQFFQPGMREALDTNRFLQFCAGITDKSIPDLNRSINQVQNRPTNSAEYLLSPHQASTRETPRADQMCHGHRMSENPITIPQCIERTAMRGSLNPKGCTREAMIINQMLHGYKMPESPMTPPKRIATEEMGQNLNEFAIKNHYLKFATNMNIHTGSGLGLHDSCDSTRILATDTRREHNAVNGGHILSDMNFDHPNNGREFVNGCHATTPQTSYFPETYKKMRTENHKNLLDGIAGNFSSTPSYLSSNWNANTASAINSEVFTFADAQRLIALEKSRASGAMLGLGLSENNRVKRSNLVPHHNGTTLHGTSNKDCIAAPDKQFRYTTTECSLLPSTPINLPRENYIPRSGSQLQYLEHNMVKGSDLLVQMHNTSPQDDTMNSCCMATPGKQIRHMISECSLLPSSLIDLPRENYIPRSGNQLQSLEHNTAKESDLLAEMHSTSRQDDTVSSCCITTSGKQIRHMTAECSLSPSNLINVPRENYIPRSGSQLQSLEHNTIKGTDLLAEMHSTSPQDDTVNNCCFATPGKQIRSVTAEAVRPPITMIRPSTGDDILRTENCQLEVSRGTTVVKPSEKPKARGRPRKEAKPGEEPKRRGRPRKEKVGNAKLTSKVSHTALLKHEGVSCVSGPYTGMTSTAKAVDSESNRDRDGISCILTTSEYDYCGSRCSKQSNGESISGAIAPSADPLDLIIQKIKFLDINKSDEMAAAEPQNALVPYKGEFGAIVPYEGKVKRKRSRAKVNLDPVTTLMWKLLMGPDLSDGADGMDKDKEKWLDEERRIFRGRVDSFIARMHLVQGDRRFSPWKGSVVDSVVGVFLTQNVSDHLSSSAYMALAARFPVKSKSHEKPAEGVFHTSPENKCGGSGPFGEVIRLQGKFFIEEISNVGSIITTEEKEGSNSNELFGTSSGDAVDCTAGVHSNSYGKLPIRLHEIGQPGTVVTATGTASVIEAEDGSLEDVVSSQNSAVSSQSSPDYLFQTTDHMGSISLPNFTAEDFAIRNMSNNIGSSTTYTELLRMQELQSKSNEKIGSSEYHGVPVSGVDKVALVNEVNNLSSRHEPVHSSVSYLQNGQVDFPGVPYVNHLDKSLYTGLDRVNDSNVTQAEAGFYQLPSSSDMANKNKTKMINSLSSLLYGIDESLSQEKSLFPPASSQEADLISPIFEQYFQPLISSESVSCTKEHSFCENNLSRSVTEAPHVKQHENSNLREVCTTRVKQMGGENFQSRCSQQDDDVGVQPTKDGNHSSSSLCPNQKANLETLQGVPSDLIQKSKDAQKSSPEVPGDGAKAKKPRLGTAKKRTYDWDSLRKEVFCNCGYKERCHTAKDSIDWEAVRQVDVREISDTIRERGMNNMLAERIKEFLNRVVRDHGSIDLEWLRDVQPDKAKDYLLSIRGLGLKSVECVRLLTLHHMAFPVDTNVGRICVRLGWVPLQPLPESLQLHLLELYPMLENIQKYLWPRLCKLDQRTLYELHYQMITFGKVFCTKSKPNCNACPMRAECKHFASAFASARLALPGPEEKSLVTSGIPIAADSSHQTYINSRPLGQLEWNANSCEHVVVENRQPIIEEPASPEPEPESLDVKEGAIEDVFVEDPDEIPTIKLNFEEFTQNLKSYMQANNIEIEDADMSKALVAITPEAASIPTPKLKNVSRLRTEHQVYELPDSHPLLEGFDQRQPDDPCPYLLSIWTPGETAQSTDAPKTFCNSQETGKLCESMTCFSCNSTREAQAQKVRGTLLIPCRTAMRGSFPLNGTYFQVNEVFADHYTSQNPIDVPRSWIWNLPRRTVYFGTSIPTIFKGLTTEDIQHCFWRGFVCVRGFDRTSRAPRPLYARLHFPASKITRNKKSAASAAARNEE